MVNDPLSRIPVGGVQLFFCTDVDETIHTFALGKATATDKARTVVVQPWAVLPAQEQLITDVIHNLAAIALATWPGWYGQATATPLANPLLAASEPLLAGQARLPTRQAISPIWAKAAAAACQASQPPLIGGFTRGQQLSQLGLAIDPGNLLIVLAVQDQKPQPQRLLGLAKAAAWMATTTAARIAIFAPLALAARPELESLGYQAITLIDPTPVALTKSDETGKAMIWYLQGRPHPLSPGEQKLATQLQHDAELGALFAYNQPVKTVCDSHYWVDLLWPAGRVVVEVDGYGIHSRRQAFNQDRHRDYELLLSGYHVLRLPHDEVMDNVAGVLQKIRNVVRQFKSVAQ